MLILWQVIQPDCLKQLENNKSLCDPLYLVIIGAYNVLSPVHWQGITHTNAPLYIIESPRTDYGEVRIKMITIHWENAIWKVINKRACLCSTSMSKTVFVYQSRSVQSPTFGCPRYIHACPLIQNIIDAISSDSIKVLEDGSIWGCHHPTTDCMISSDR